MQIEVQETELVNKSLHVADAEKVHVIASESTSQQQQLSSTNSSPALEKH